MKISDDFIINFIIKRKEARYLKASFLFCVKTIICGGPHHIIKLLVILLIAELTDRLFFEFVYQELSCFKIDMIVHSKTADERDVFRYALRIAVFYFAYYTIKFKSDCGIGNIVDVGGLFE